MSLRGRRIRSAWPVAGPVAIFAVLLSLVVPAVALGDPPTTAPPETINIVEGSHYQNYVGTLTETNCPSVVVVEVAHAASADPTNTSCGQLAPTGTINWGDGSAATAATFTAATEVVKAQVRGGPAAIGPPINEPDCTEASSDNCTWTVTDGGDHIYAHAGEYKITWTYSVTDGPQGTVTGSRSFYTKVGLAATTVTVTGVHVTRDAHNNATLVGGVSYPNASATHCDFTATIDWGDGNTTPATVEPNNSITAPICGPPVNEDRPAAVTAKLATPNAAASGLTVAGSHTYASSSDPDSDQATVTVTYKYPQASSDPNAPADPDPPPSGSAQAAVPYPATATTGPATLIDVTTATLTGHVDPRGGSVVDCHFEYGTTTAYGKTAPCSPSTMTGATPVSAAVTGLAANTTYHYDLVFTTSVGTVSDPGDQSFTTQPAPPAGAPDAATGSATSVAQTTATLNGVVNPVGGTLSDCHFEYGSSTDYLYKVPCAQTSLTGTGNIAVSADVTGLQAGATWHFRLVAANPGAPATHGTDETFTTLPDCGVTVKFRWAEVTGCLLDDNGVYTATPGTAVDVNGLTLDPGPDVGVTINPTTDTLQSDNVAISVKRPAGQAGDPIFLYLGAINWTIPPPAQGAVNSSNVPTVPITTLSLPTQEDGTTDDIDGLKMDGDLQLSFDQDFGADLGGNAWLPFTDWIDHALGITGAIQFHAAPGAGLTAGSEQIQEANWSLLGAVGVKNLILSYDPVQDIWYGNGQIELPTPNQLTIGASLSMQHGNFRSFSATLDNANIAIAGGVFLQTIYVTVGLHPTTLGGQLGVSFGPEVDGKAVVKVIGGFTYQAAYNDQPELLQATGQITVKWLKGLNAYFDYYEPGGFRFGANFEPDPDAPLDFKANLQGAIDDDHFDLDGQVSVTLRYVGLSAGAEVLVSDIGAVACAHLSAFGFGWSPGVGYTWSTHAWDLMGSGCSVGPWQTLQLGIGQGNNEGGLNTAVGSPRWVHLPAGSDLVQLNGAGGAPKVTLTGPGGAHVTVPTNSAKPYLIRGFQVLQDSHDRRTWIAIQHGGGTWKVTPEHGSTPIVRVRGAQLLPTPTASGRVTGKGSRRTLSWRLAPIHGEKVTFWEMGKGVAKIIGSSSKTHGTLRFTPATGVAGKRTIKAEITIDGHPRTDITIAHFTAAALRKPGKPKRLTVAASGMGVKVSWAAASGVSSYLVRVVVTKGDGATLTDQVRAPKHAAVLTDVNPIKAATVTVIPQSVTGVPGPAATATYPSHKPKPKPKGK